MSGKIGEKINLLLKGKRTEEERLADALEALTTTHPVLDKQNAESVKKAIQNLPDESPE